MLRSKVAVPLTLVFTGISLGWFISTDGFVKLFAQSPANTKKNDGSVLPFPPIPTTSVAGPTVRESKMAWRKEPPRLKADAPNVLVVLIDDIGFGVADTFGGEVHTPTLSKLPNYRIELNNAIYSI